MATLTPNPADDIFGDDELDEASHEVELEDETQPRSRVDEERRFEERIAFVCTMMKVPNLYPEQVQVLRALEKGKDVCLLARTGFGKSLVFQALYWMHVKTLMQKPGRERTGIARPKKGITIVFVPLSGLGEEQVEKLNRDEGKEVAFFFDRSKMEPHHVRDIAAGKYRIVYLSPEKALSQTSSDYLWSQPEFRAQVNLVAVDEVHLVHDW
jgi:superfamily II DNA helicase RecQ